MKVLINADDFGMTLGVSRAISELILEGTISTTSAMACSKDLESSLRYSEGLEGKIGVHLQISADAPLSNGKTLVDPTTGEFYKKPVPSGVSSEEVRTEWELQIEKVSNLLGHKPSHLDTHHDYHCDPRFSEVFLELAEQHDLPVRGGAIQTDSSPKVRSTNPVVRGWSSVGTAETLLKELASIQNPVGIIEVISHPAYCDDDLRAKSSWTDVREKEMAELRRFAKINPYRLVDYSSVT